MSGGSAFAALHYGPVPFLLPNAWDVASALLLQAAGFPAIGTTSLGVTAAAGLPASAGAGRELTLALAGTLAARLNVPLTVDLENGYSDDPALVADLAARLVDRGVAGINLEDGRPDGRLRSTAEHAAVIQAVTAAAPDLFVNARTDTWWLSIGREESRPEEAVRRLRAYRDAGASGVFAPGLPDLAAAGVSRISTGSALYRHAVAAAFDTATAARTGNAPATAPTDYTALQRLLRPTGNIPTIG